MADLTQRSRSYLLDDDGAETSEAGRLDQRARAMFALEAPALAEHGLRPGQTIVDLGCGQGTYLGLVADAFAGSRCVGLDRNEKLLARAAGVPGVAATAACDLANRQALLGALGRQQPDAVYSRFVFQHMNDAERAAVLGALREAAGSRPLRVILIDVDSASGYFEPDSPLLTEARTQLAAQQARAGGNRFIGSRLEALLAAAGFRDLRATRVSVDSDRLGFAAWWAAFGPVLCDSLHHRPSAREAMLEWGRDPGTAKGFRAGFELFFASGR